MPGGWGDKDKKGDDKPRIFTKKDVESWLEGANKKGMTKSPICMVFYGDDGVGKSGMALDCRDEQAIKDGKKVVVIDVDGSCGPLKNKFYRDDDNVIVIDPLVQLETGDIDYVTTYNKILALIKYLREEEDNMNLQAVILDGLDSLLKICEYVMRYEDLEVDPNVQIKDQWQWSKRNRRYLTVVQLIKRFKCDSFFTTHLKELKEYRAGQLITKDRVPNWQEQTPGIMFQKVRLVRTSSEGITKFKAMVEKSKGALELEGKEYTVATVSQGKTEWKGLHELYAAIRGS